MADRTDLHRVAADRMQAAERVAATRAFALGAESLGRATRILVTSATVLGSLALILWFTGGSAYAASANRTSVESITPGANLSPSPGRVSLIGAGAAGDAPCTVSINTPSCASDDPDLTVDGVYSGDTSGCVFTWSANWGDGSAAQTITSDGHPSSGTYYLANHIYQSQVAQTFSIALTAVSVSGPCSIVGGSYTFALSPIPTVNCKGKLPPVNLNVARVVYAEAVRLQVSDKVELSAFEAAYVESRFNNCSNGDHSSVGVFQQLKSWGSAATRENVADASDLYLEKAIAVASNHPTYTAAEIAQAVQRSAHSGRYAAAESEAESIISQVDGE